MESCILVHQMSYPSKPPTSCLSQMLHPIVIEPQFYPMFMQVKPSSAAGSAGPFHLEEAETPVKVAAIGQLVSGESF